MTDQMSIDQFNNGLRTSQFYRDWMRAHGVDTSRAIKLTDQQRKALQRDLAAIGVPFEKGIEIDPAGNMNQDEGWSKHRKWMIPAAIAVGTLGFGAAGIGPAAGLFGGSTPTALGLPVGFGVTTEGAIAAPAAVGAGAGAGGFSFGSLTPQLINTGGSLAGNFLAGRAASKAAEAQERAAREALDFEKGAYYDEQARLRPYSDLGGQAYIRMGERLGLKPSAASAPAPTNPVDRMFTFSRQPRPVGPGMTPGAAAQPRIGERKSFPSGRVGEWDGRGWKAVS